MEAANSNIQPSQNTYSIEITGEPGASYKSIKALKWDNIPPLAIITGKNGTGKSQLLEFIARKKLESRFQTPSTLQLSTRGVIITASSVGYLPSDWKLTSAVKAGVYELQTIKEHFLAHSSNLKQTGYLRALEYAEKQEHEKYSLDNYAFAFDQNDTVHGLPHVIFSHRLRVAERLEQGKTDQEIRSEIGAPPWELINEAFEIADFPYSISSPLDQKIADGYVAKFINKRNGAVIDPGDFSSGEKMLLNLVLWVYSTRHLAIVPKLLLLDEPDAHLHPSMTHQLLAVLKDFLVDRHGVKVILTTHSPSTVALAPEGSVFEMSLDGDPRIVPSPSKEATVSLLTAGLVVVTPSTKIVLVEDEDDVGFYEMIRDLLLEKGPSKDPMNISQSPTLIFLPASNGKNQNKVGGGSSVVSAWVNKFDQEPLNTFFKGLIDNDGKNFDKGGVSVLRRHSIENYILDPFAVYAHLLTIGAAPPMRNSSISAGNEHLIRSLDESQLYEICSTICAAVEPYLVLETPALRGETPVAFTNGRVVPYPNWMLSYRGHDLLPAFQNAFGGHNRINPVLQKIAFKRVRLIPVDLAETFCKLQA